jgi:hypothetical protein
MVCIYENTKVRFSRLKRRGEEMKYNEDGTIDNEKLSSTISKASEINFLKDDNTIFKNELASITSV